MKRTVHFEILADDPEKAADFYRQVFEWDISTWGGEQAYWLVNTGPDDEPGINGAIMQRHFDQAVVNTQEVESLAEALEHIDGAGGKVVQGPNEIPGVGTHAYCADPEGNLFGVLEPVQEDQD
jgi:predicted enzyme related to lactoylglutathione lyase